MSFRSLTTLPLCLHRRLACRCVRPKITARSSAHDGIARASTALLKQAGDFHVSQQESHPAWCADFPARSGDISLNASEASHSTRNNVEVTPEPILPQIHTIPQCNEAIPSDAEPINHRTETGVHSLQQSNQQQARRRPWPQEGRIRWESLYSQLRQIRSEPHVSVRNALSEHHKLAVEFTSCVDAAEFKQRWEGMPVTEKVHLLPSLLIGSLVDSAALTLFVLSHITWIPRNFHVRMQCLRHIHLAYPQELAVGSINRKIFEGQIARLRHAEVWQCDDMPISHLDTLLSWSDPDQCEQIIAAFLKLYPHARPESFLPIITSYTKHDNITKALEYFKRLPIELLQNPTPSVKQARDHLLKRDVVTKLENRSNFSVLPQLLALGLQPDAALHNAVLEAAVTNGVPDVAWDLYHYLKDSCLDINARSYLILLKDAFTRGNVPAVNEIMTEIHANEDLIKDPYLIAYSMNIVRNICFFERKAPSFVALSHIMALYDRAYSRAPLYKLGILREALGANADAHLPEPSPGSLAFTIWTYILVQHSGQPVFTLWHRIKQLIESNDQTFVAAARFDMMYNALILFYARTPSTVARALEVLRYMLGTKLCMPTSRTWSIMVCGFLKHNQVEQAESILRMMRLRGLKFEELSNEYIPPRYSLEDMTARVQSTLDERAMPDGAEDLIGAASDRM